MKKINAKEIVLVSMLLIVGLTGACNRSTTVERSVDVGPGDNVKQETTVHEQTSTTVKPDTDVDVETKVNTP